jgi:hypothetical protein
MRWAIASADTSMTKGYDGTPTSMLQILIGLLKFKKNRGSEIGNTPILVFTVKKNL